MISSARIRELVSENCRLEVPPEVLSDTDNLFEAGMNSHGSVNLMIAIEEEFGVVFPDALIRKANFRSITALREAVQGLFGLVYASEE